MSIYKTACISMLIILLSGCNPFSAPPEEPPSKEGIKEVFEESTEVIKKEPVIVDITEMEKYHDPMDGFKPILIDAELASPIGENNTSFSYSGDIPFTLSVLNTGTESFLFKIQNVDKNSLVTNGVLASKESYEKIFDGFPEGTYVITFRVEEEEPPSNIKLKVKLELLPYTPESK